MPLLDILNFEFPEGADSQDKGRPHRQIIGLNSFYLFWELGLGANLPKGFFLLVSLKGLTIKTPGSTPDGRKKNVSRKHPPHG